jgi:hypothetical protein
MPHAHQYETAAAAGHNGDERRLRQRALTVRSHTKYDNTKPLDTQRARTTKCDDAATAAVIVALPEHSLVAVKLM